MEGDRVIFLVKIVSPKHNPHHPEDRIDVEMKELAVLKNKSTLSNDAVLEEQAESSLPPLTAEMEDLINLILT